MVSNVFEEIAAERQKPSQNIFDEIYAERQRDLEPKISAAPEEGLFTQATRAAGNALSPILGPSQEQVMRESIPVVQPDGSTVYQYKPLGDRFQQEGLLAPIARTEDVINSIPVLAPQEDDGVWTSAARGLGRGTVGVLNSLTSPAAAPLLASGAAEASAFRSAGKGVGTYLPSQIPNINRAAAGGFAASMIPTIPEQVVGFSESKNPGEYVERGIGLAGTGLGIVGGGLAARSPRHAQAEIAASADLPATAEVLNRQGDEDISLTRNQPTIFNEIAKERAAEPTGTTASEEQPAQPTITEQTAAPIIEPAVTSDVPVSEITSTGESNISVDESSPIVQQSEVTKIANEQLNLSANREPVPTTVGSPLEPSVIVGDSSGIPGGDATGVIPEAGGTVETGGMARERLIPSPDRTKLQQGKYDAFVSREKARLDERIDKGAELEVATPEDYRARALIEQEYDTARRNAPIGNPNHPQTIRLRELQAQLAGPITKTRYRLINPDGTFIELSPMQAEYVDSSLTQKSQTPETQTNKPNETNTQPKIDIPTTEPRTNLDSNAQENPSGINQEERNQAVEQVTNGGEIPPVLVNENLGPGAANAQEFAEMPVNRTSTMNRIANEERAARGELPVLKEAIQSNPTTFDMAEKTIEANPHLGRETVVGLLEGTKKEVSEVDEAVLLAEKIRLQNERTMEAERASDPLTSKEARDAARKRWDDLETQITQLDQATRKSGTIWGRLGQFRQRLMRDDYTFEAMERKARVSKGRPLTPEESTALKAESEKIATEEKKVEEAQVRAETKAREDAFESTITDLKKKLAGRKGPNVDKRILDYAEKIVKGWETAATEASKRLKARLAYAGAAPDPTILLDLTIIARAKIGRGLIKAGNFISDVVGEYGEAVRPYAQQAWDAAQAELDNIATELPKVVRDKVKKAIINTPEAIVNRITDTIQTRLAEGGDLASLKGLVDRLALEFVRKGITEREPLLNAVHSVLEPLIPNIQRQETADLISGYGQFKTLDKEAAKVTLRGLKGELQQIAKIQDMQAKLAPKKTGIERRTPTTEERTLIRQVNDLKKKGGFEVTDPEQQLKTALGAIQTRLRNEIDDLDNAILNKEPIVRENGKIDYDDETKALQAQRDAKKAEYDELFPKAPQTAESQIAIALKSLDRSITDLQSNIKEGKLYSANKRNTLTSPELTAKKAELEALREQREHLRDLDTARIEAQKEAQLLKAIDDVQNGVKQPNIGVDTVESKRITELKEQLQKLREARNESPEARQKQIDKALAVAKNSLEDYNKRLADNDLASRAGKEPLRSDELDDVRMQRDAVAAMIRELQEAAKPKKSPEEIALQNYKSRAASRIAEMQKRISESDFAPREKTQIKLDAEGRKAEFALNEMKKKFNEARHNDALKRRPLPKKIFHGLRDILNTARAVMTSFDVSAVLRQGGFVSLGNPVRAAKNIGPMFRALSSEKRRFEIDKSIWERPNANLYRQSKLTIVDPNEINMNKQEEAYMGRWAQKIPGVGASERAYTTYLNLLRADTFDALHSALSRDGAMTKEEVDAIANYINVATGRGNLAGASGTTASLNSLFFSPRLMVSRFEMLAGSPFFKGSAKTRKAIAQEYAKFLVAAGIVSSLALGAGASIETDPRSSDFMKFRFGDTRLDPWGGLVQVAVLMSRLANGKKKTLAGNVQNIRATSTEKIPFGGEDAWDLTGRFLRTKLNPALGAAVDIVSGSNVVGQPVEPVSAVAKTVVPLTVQDIKQTMEDQGIAAGTVESLLSLLGVGMQTFESREEQKQKQLQLSSQIQ